MKRLSETSALRRLHRIKEGLRSDLEAYEERAASCLTCPTPGECCLDEHFVNVHVSRLEAVAISDVIDGLDPFRRAAVLERLENVSLRLIAKADGRNATFACPFYERSTGCIVHDEAKPAPCMVHACYERAEDLPPDDRQDQAENAIYRLNKRVYGSSTLDPLPLAVQAVRRVRRKKAMTTPASSQPAT